MNATTQTLQQPKWIRITHYVLTALLVVDMLMAGLAFLASAVTAVPQITDTFLRLGYPLYIVPMLGLIKLAAVAALLKGSTWREWAHVGLFFMFLLAFYSHMSAGDGLAGSLPALLVFVLNLAAYALFRKLQPKS